MGGLRIPGRIEHRPYPPEVLEFERRLNASVRAGRPGPGC
jgi:hypothetical protein